MKEFTLRAPDALEALFEGLAAHMPEVEMVRSEDRPAGDLPDIDRRVATAMRTLTEKKVMRHLYDYTWVMVVIGDGALKEMGAFKSPQAFIDYMKELGVERLPDRKALNAWGNKVIGKYPHWVFTDTSNPKEILRRKNVAKLFLSSLRG